jgi:hypothetical protein
MKTKAKSSPLKKSTVKKAAVKKAAPKKSAPKKAATKRSTAQARGTKKPARLKAVASRARAKATPRRATRGWVLKSKPLEWTPQSPDSTWVELSIELVETEPLVWRRIQIQTSLSMFDLHRAIQIAMGWRNSHYAIFRTQDVLAALPVMIDGQQDAGTVDMNTVLIRDFLAKPGQSVWYEYDFGDSWQHKITCERVVETRPGDHAHPLCVGGENACPPEDCGGVPGFAALRQVLTDPKHPGYRDLKAWIAAVNPGYDLKRFSPDTANELFRDAELADIRFSGWGIER